MAKIKTFELDRWSEPDEKRRVRHIGMADAKETFDRLQTHLELKGLLPDEYFLFSDELTGELPEFDQALCIPNFGASEGIYLDISLACRDKDGKRYFQNFATGKTLGETADDYQLSASNGKYTTPSNSQSVSLTERKLLNTDEVRRVKRPHQIITSRDHPAMMYAPDLSQWMFNKMLGLGDMEHNRRLREEREQKRPIITDTKQEIALWNIWIYYQKDIMRRLAQQKGAMGGGLDDD